MTIQVSAITAFRLTTADARRLANFYGELGFAVRRSRRIRDEEMALLGLEGSGTRVTLRLGGQRIDLDSFEVPGLAYPADATAADLRFQHLAIVTDDAEVAWRRAEALGATAISSSGPVRLPPATGVAAAIKCRDPEGHPLELLQLLPEHARPWSGTHLLGVDHSAISVSDVDASRRFYEALGLSVSDPTLNQGPTQMVLDGLPEAEVDVVPMLPQQDTPHLELLGYRRPRPIGLPADGLRPNDVAATRVVWAANRDELIRDPDGHIHLLRRQERR